MEPTARDQYDAQLHEQRAELHAERLKRLRTLNTLHAMLTVFALVWASLLTIILWRFTF